MEGMKPYIHKVNYYETDKMGITHHSNYVRFMEETRVFYMDEMGWSYAKMEETGNTGSVFEYHLIPKGYALSLANEYTKETVVEENVELIPYYMITLRGLVNEVLFVEVDGETHTLSESVPELNQYLQSKDYVVGTTDANIVVNGGESIPNDMDVVVMKRNIVVIEMDGKVSKNEVNVKDLATSISELTGVDASSILIEVEYDDIKGMARIFYENY